MSQADFFAEALPVRARRTDPGTSHQAAAMSTELAKVHQQRVLSALRRSLVPLGAEQIAVLADLDAYQVRKRLPELQDQHLVELAPGERKTSSGRSERLWQPMSPWASYAAEKAAWLEANPHAGSDEIEAAAQAIAQRWGV